MNVIIIEDELAGANELKVLIQSLIGGIHISAILRSVDESVLWFKHHPPPDLIFAAIQLEGGLSFDIVQRAGIRVPVVYCSTTDAYALRAFENNGIDFILKPISRERLTKTFAKLNDFRNTLKEGNYTFEWGGAEKMADKRGRETFLVYFKGRIIPLPSSKIDVVRSLNNVVYVYTGNKKYEIRETVESLVAQLGSTDFYRANRQWIVRRKSIVRIEHLKARKLGIHLNVVTDEVIVSKAKATDFLKWLRKV